MGFVFGCESGHVCFAVACCFALLFRILDLEIEDGIMDEEEIYLYWNQGSRGDGMKCCLTAYLHRVRLRASAILVEE